MAVVCANSHEDGIKPTHPFDSVKIYYWKKRPNRPESKATPGWRYHKGDCYSKLFEPRAEAIQAAKDAGFRTVFDDLGNAIY